MKIQLNFLTENKEKMQTCIDYWSQDDKNHFAFSIREIATIHNLKYNGLSKQIAEWCQAYSLNDPCEQCQERFWVYKSRNEYKERISSRRSWICNVCQEVNIIAQREREQQQLANIQEYFSYRQPGTLCFREGNNTPNSLQEIVAYLSLIRLNATEDFTYIAPLLNIDKGRLSPSRDYDIELIRMLVDNDVLSPNTNNSPMDAFVFEDEEFTGSYYLDRVAWKFPSSMEQHTSNIILEPSNLIEDLEEILQNMVWPKIWNDEWIPLWRKIALEECLQYLDLCMVEHGFDFTAGQKTRQVLLNALNTYSVAQIYNFIWGASRDAAAYYMREKTPKRQAANTVVGSIQRKAQRANAEGWDVKAFGRDRRCSQTMISQVLFDVVLHIGEEGFVRAPG